MQSRVKVTGLTTAVSGTPVRAGRAYPLSVLDHAMGMHELRLVFYYARGDMEKLKESLTEVLSFYPPVTGRLRRRDDNGNWEVKCSDAGVRVLEAKVHGSLTGWLRSPHAAADELLLTHWIDMPDDPCIWSPFYVQINEFEDGGIAIGLSCTHMHADPICATLLIKAWSDTHRLSSITFPPFFHPPGLQGRSQPNTDTKSAKYYADKSKSKHPLDVKMATATLRFSNAAVKKCLDEVQGQCPDASPFEVLAALFWSRVTTAKALLQGGETHTSLSLCIEFRKLMHAPLPHGFYGNALHLSSVSSSAEEMVQGGIGYITNCLHCHLSGINEEEYWSAIDWLESQRDKTGKFPPPFRMYGPELTCANFEHVFAYGAMFEKDVKPLHVGYHVGNVKGEGMILVLPSPEEGSSRTVSVTLPADVLETVLKDNELLRLEPTFLFTGNQ